MGLRELQKQNEVNLTTLFCALYILLNLIFAFSCFSGGEGLPGFSVGSSLMGSLFNDPVLPKNNKEI